MDRTEEEMVSIDFSGNISVLQDLISKAKKKNGSYRQLGRMLGYKAKKSNPLNLWYTGRTQMPLQKLKEICDYVNEDFEKILSFPNISAEGRYSHRGIPIKNIISE